MDFVHYNKIIFIRDAANELKVLFRDILYCQEIWQDLIT